MDQLLTNHYVISDPNQSQQSAMYLYIKQRALLARLCLSVKVLTARTPDVMHIKAAQHH